LSTQNAQGSVCESYVSPAWLRSSRESSSTAAVVSMGPGRLIGIWRRSRNVVDIAVAAFSGAHTLVSSHHTMPSLSATYPLQAWSQMPYSLMAWCNHPVYKGDCERRVFSDLTGRTCVATTLRQGFALATVPKKRRYAGDRSSLCWRPCLRQTTAQDVGFQPQERVWFLVGRLRQDGIHRTAGLANADNTSEPFVIKGHLVMVG
jgi:hypothetical protein